MPRIVLLAFVLAISLASGCAVTSTEKVGADGSRTTTRSVEWVPGQYPPGYYYVEPPFYHYEYRGSYPIRDGRACKGPYGQTHNGICYPEKPYWIR